MSLIQRAPTTANIGLWTRYIILYVFQLRTNILQIKNAFAPSSATISAVKEWLSDAGIGADRTRMSKSMTWIRFNITVAEAESLLKTKYDIYENVETGKDHLACESYSVPSHIREHIDFITPTIHFDAMVKPKKTRRDLQGRSLSTKPGTQVKQKPDALVPQPAVTFSLANCYTYVTPDCLRSLYNFTNGTLALYVSFLCCCAPR